MQTSSTLNADIDRYKAYLKADPQNHLLWLNLGDLYHRVSRFDEAIACYERCAEYTSNRAIPTSRIAAIMISQQRFAEAEKVFASLIEEGEQGPELLHNLGLARFYQEHWLEAQQCFEAVIEAGLNTPDTLHYLSRCLHQQGKMDEAIQIYKQRIGLLDDDDGKGYLALLQMDAGNMTTAEELAHTVLSTSPDNTDAGIVVGNANIEKQDMANAEPYFKKVIGLEPDNGRAWLGQGLVHLYRQEHAKAITIFEKTAQLMPKSAGILVTLAWAMLTSNDFAGAETIFRRAVDVDRNFAESHGGLAAALALQGKIAAAEVSLKRAAKLNKTNFGGVYAQSILLKLKGKDKLATEIVARALQQPPVEGALPLVDHISTYLQKRHFGKNTTSETF